MDNVEVVLLAHVLSVINKLDRYRWVLITDGQVDIPSEKRRNIDKETGKCTPLDLYGNGFYLELEPFNLDVDVRLEYALPSGELIRTVLLDNSSTWIAPTDDEQSEVRR